MKTKIPLTTFASALIFLPSAFGQGLLTPPGPPSPTMKSLSQIEPRTAIAASTTITAPGAYYLTGNLTVSSGNAITIAANNVALDLNGFTISSTASPAGGTAILLNSGLTNILIANGFIYSPVTNNGAAVYGGNGFFNGVFYTGAMPVNVRVTELAVSGCVSNGIYLNNNVGFNTANTVDGCLVSDCGSFGIIAELVVDSVSSTGRGSGIFCASASRSRGMSYSGGGLLAAVQAENCAGQCGSFTGISTGIALNCYGKSSTGTGLNAQLTDSCYGETGTTTSYAMQTGNANNCFGNHTGNGGVGLFASGIAIGSVGVSSGTGSYGIYGNLVNGCYGAGATTILFVNKYNSP